MSQARATKTNATADDGRLDEIAAELYAVRPDEFAAARDDQVRTARADGQTALARELGRLRKPTQSAWLINLLWRDQREVIEALFQLADELSRAQAEASGPDLHRLTGQRRELEAALIRRARTLAEAAGVSVSAAMEREAQDTLAAALARPEVAEEVRTGRLVKPATYAGFGTVFGEVGGAAPAPGVDAQQATRAPARPDDADRDEVGERRKTAERRKLAERRESAERRVAEARAAVEQTMGALAERGRAVEAAQQAQQTTLRQQADVRHQLDELQQQLSRLEVEVAQVVQVADTTERQRQVAQKTHAAALRALQAAEQDLADLTPLEQ